MIASPSRPPQRALNVLETIDLSEKFPRDRYKRVIAELRERFRQLQYELLQAEVPTVIVFEGWVASGTEDIIRRLTGRVDPRAFEVHPAAPPSILEQRYHFLWRFQNRLPEDGHMALFDQSWYRRVLLERVEKRVKKREWRAAYEQISQFERWLADDGQVLVKLWFQISAKQQRRRLERLGKDPLTRWRVERGEWRQNHRYDRWMRAVEEMLARTDTPHAPWTVVAATDPRLTRVRVLETLVEAMQRALGRQQSMPTRVSRHNVARNATRADREQRKTEERERARALARETGLELTENGE